MDIERLRLSETVFVTRPTVPSLDEYVEHLRDIWESRRLTNRGRFHEELEGALAEYLETDGLSLFCNGTIGLLVALQSLNVASGEVITTPFTFPATVHAIHWNRLSPVFCDVDPLTWNLDPGRVERLITPDTRAILAVHVYGTPCDVDALERIGREHGIPVVYDAAHGFAVRYRGKSLLAYGDCSVTSFHATKLYTTVEGGAVRTSSPEWTSRVRLLRNFGIAGEEEVLCPGINGKMNELQAAFGLLTLKTVDDEIRARDNIASCYRAELDGIRGLTFMPDMDGLERNFAYFPMLVDASRFGMSRDELHGLLRACNVWTRKYFHPLCSRYSCYSTLPSADPALLPVAERVAQEVLCLPIHGSLELDVARHIAKIIRVAATSRTGSSD
jgi:dTDP-4-amino-4,6-dideoxygalactose transaminase